MIACWLRHVELEPQEGSKLCDFNCTSRADER